MTIFVSKYKADTKALDKLVERVALLKRTQLGVGFFDGDIHEPSGETAAYIAAINNEGSPSDNIPSRPFLTEALSMSFKGKAALRPIKDILNYKIPLKKTLSLIGEQAVIMVKWNIENGAWVDNARKTIEIKGFNNPLVHTSTLPSLTKYKIF